MAAWRLRETQSASLKFKLSRNTQSLIEESIKRLKNEASYGAVYTTPKKKWHKAELMNDPKRNRSKCNATQFRSSVKISNWKDLGGVDTTGEEVNVHNHESIRAAPPSAAAASPSAAPLSAAAAAPSRIPSINLENENTTPPHTTEKHPSATSQQFLSKILAFLKSLNKAINTPLEELIRITKALIEWRGRDG